MPSYVRTLGNLKQAKDFEPLQPCDLKRLGAVACRYTWSPIVFAQNYRSRSNFMYSDYMGLDVDNTEGEPYTLEQAINDWCDSACIIGLTKSHQIEKHTAEMVYPPADRFRIITPWQRRITSLDEYEYNLRQYTQAHQQFDEACVDGARLFYPLQKIVYANFEGELQPVVSLPVKTAAEQELHSILLAAQKRQRLTKGIPKYILKFLNEGKIFGGSRNLSVYATTRELLEHGYLPEKILDLLAKSPFNRSDFPESELLTAYRSATKNFVQK